MKLLTLLGAASLALVAGCVSDQASVNDHWSTYSIGPRVGRAFLGYDSETDGESYLEFQWRRKQESSLTVRRHFFNHNPDNPFQSEARNYPAPRPANSPFPNPLSYFHLTLLDGPIATFDQGGFDEFWGGIGETVEPLSVVISSLLYDALGLPDAEAQAGSK